VHRVHGVVALAAADRLAYVHRVFRCEFPTLGGRRLPDHLGNGLGHARARDGALAAVPRQHLLPLDALARLLRALPRLRAALRADLLGKRQPDPRRQRAHLRHVSALRALHVRARAALDGRGHLDRRRLTGLALAGGSVLTMMLVMSLPYLELSRLGLIPSYGEEGETPIGLVPYFAAIPAWRYLQEQGVGSVGYTLALLAVL